MPRLAAVLLLAILVPTAGPAQGEPPPARQTELLHRLKQDCGSCHGMTMKGGLGPALLPATLAQRPNEELIEIILDGRPGTPMPPWAFEIQATEAAWLVQQLKKGLDDGR